METKYEVKKAENAKGVYKIERQELYRMIKDIKTKRENPGDGIVVDRVTVLLGEDLNYVKTTWSWGTLLSYIEDVYLSFDFAFIEAPNLNFGFNLVILSSRGNTVRRIAVDLPFNFKKDLKLVKTNIFPKVNKAFYAKPGVIKEYNL